MAVQIITEHRSEPVELNNTNSYHVIVTRSGGISSADGEHGIFLTNLSADFDSQAEVSVLGAIDAGVSGIMLSDGLAVPGTVGQVNVLVGEQGTVFGGYAGAQIVTHNVVFKNYGTVAGRSYGIEFTATVNNNFSNDGIIHGSKHGIFAQYDGRKSSIVNGEGGHISGNDTAIYLGLDNSPRLAAVPDDDGNGVPDWREGVTNNGTITGRHGIIFEEGGKVTNTGTITGEVTGVQLGSDENLDATLSNSGKIIAAQAVVGSFGKDIITNDGRIEGDINLQGGDDYYRGTSGVHLGSIDLGHGNDTALGGAGDEIFATPSGSDFVDGGQGSDTLILSTVGVDISFDLGNTGRQDVAGDLVIARNMENLTTSDGNDNVRGTSSNNEIRTAGGDDTIQSLAGDDFIDSGDGNDTVSYAGQTAVTVDLGQVISQWTGIGYQEIRNVENVSGSSAADVLTGDFNDNVLLGGLGDDTLNGAEGTDTADYRGTGGVQVDLAAGLVTGAHGSDSIANFEIVLTGDGNDLVELGQNAEQITTGKGDDTIVAAAGEGTDIVDGGDDQDLLSYDGSERFIATLVDAGVGTAQIVGADDAVLGTVELTSIEHLRGGRGNDELTGNSGDNSLDGGMGNDILAGGDGRDTASFAGSADLLINLGTEGVAQATAYGEKMFNSIENLRAGTGNDRLTGNASANSLWGDAGNDTLDGGAEADILDGGEGTDTAVFTGDAVVVDLTAKTATQGGATDTLASIENLVGTANGDSLTGDTKDNVFDGGLGNDSINGGGGADSVLYAGANAVVVNLAAGTASRGAETDSLTGIANIVGSDAGDSLTGNGAVNRLEGSGGNDTLGVSDGADVLDGGDGVDTAVAAAGGSVIDLAAQVAGGARLISVENAQGSGGADTLVGNNAGNLLDGAGGNDVFITGSGNDTIRGGGGVDTLVLNRGGAATVNLAITTAQNTGSGFDVISDVANLTGGAGADAFTGNGGANVLVGNEGDDTLDGGAGDDVLDGGAGINTAVFSGDVAVVVDLNNGGAQNTGQGLDTLIGITNVVGSNAADRLTGNGGNNTLSGANGDDVFSGGGGSDVLDGGEGNDTVVLTGASAVVDLGAGTANDGVTNASLLSIESVTGTSGADVFVGSAGDNVINGGEGNDTITGGYGNDVILGGGGVNTALYNGAEGAVVNLADKGSQNTVGYGFDTLDGIATLIGGAGADNFTGDDFANLLIGGAGNDALIGGGGNDTLDGGVGIDVINGGAGYDILTYENDGPVIVRLSGGKGSEAITGIERVIASGSNDQLYGSKAGDELVGGAGNDRIEGLAGKDLLTGGAGKDTFKFTNVKHSLKGKKADVLLDFTSKQDKIDLRTIDGDKTKPGNGKFSIFTTSKKGPDFDEGVGGQLHFNKKNGVLYAEINGDGKSDMEIMLGGAKKLAKGDFFL
jgi:Ca2+-binding RTX toxin-like protein